MSTLSSPLISIDELSSQIDNPNLILLDASWYMPAMNRDGLEEWKQRRIGEARHFDFHHVFSDAESSYPHTMPSAEHFTKNAQALGINQDSHIVVYDGMGLFASPRVWWMFKAMGHNKVSVLDGGFPAWLNAGLPTIQTPPITPVQGDFIATYDATKFSTSDFILESLDTDKHVVVDARGVSRFDGSEAEPREGIRSGHIPSSVNLPFTAVIDEGFLKPIVELEALLSPFACLETSLVFTCGSGVTACHLALAAEVCGYKNLSVYDGSWSEWGARHELPIATV